MDSAGGNYHVIFGFAQIRVLELGKYGRHSTDTPIVVTTGTSGPPYSAKFVMHVETGIGKVAAVWIVMGNILIEWGRRSPALHPRAID